jgi:nucleotide-binding universal stress UspA family protein
MKSILVPTDFSNYALFALKVAANIAREIKAEIELVHVCNLLSVGAQQYHYYYSKYNKEIIQNANEKLNELIALDFLKGIVIKKHIISDMLMWEAICDERFINVDLIVIGSHGTSGFNNLFIGSNTEKIVRLAEPPVLTIKNNIEDFAIKKMVFASNFFEESYEAFKKVKFFADLYHAHIDLLKVITPKDFESTPVSQRLIGDFAHKFNLKNYTINIYNAHNIENGIIDFCDKQGSDLIAIETHGRTGLAHLINGSLAEDIVKHEALPVLSIKMHNPPEYVSKLLSYNKNYGNWGNE